MANYGWKWSLLLFWMQWLVREEYELWKKREWYKTLKVESKHLQPLTGNSDKFLFLLQPIICQNKAMESSDGKSNSNSLVPSRRGRLGCDKMWHHLSNLSGELALPRSFGLRELTWGRGCSSKCCLMIIYLYQSLRISRQIDRSERL